MAVTAAARALLSPLVSCSYRTASPAPSMLALSGSENAASGIETETFRPGWKPQAVQSSTRALRQVRKRVPYAGPHRKHLDYGGGLHAHGPCTPDSGGISLTGDSFDDGSISKEWQISFSTPWFL
ncbi:hypothetical protein B0O99DRAFT_690643 [Bisporella sp. PMI_857]|nr:hypothetical protein B0O99DRAFT_690643 [Bisporella sp. PMI_857]